MSVTIRRLGSLLGTILLALTGAVAITTSSSELAQARCVNGAPTISKFYNPAKPSQSLITETPVAGTCNNNGTYTSKGVSAAGWEGFEFRENGGVWYKPQIQGDGSIFWYASSHKSYIEFCAIHESSGLGWCGFGHSYYPHKITINDIVTSSGGYGGPALNTKYAGLDSGF